ncbi:histidinol dehydrogenase [Kribbella sp. NPDC056345]|uniref:histidinol dehydrogenase n=1 Tax=Kribbella sp. NPDC056345 TaxID=3345789 RepID=UPI0035D9F28D
MAEHLKTGWPQQVERQQEVIDTVSRILREVEHEGEPAIRRWSARLDGWEPPTFVVPAERIKAAAETVDDELAEQLEFARSQVERFARAQRDTLQDLEIETLPGVVLGHRHLPVAKVGSYSPGGRYPLIASSIMTVTVPKVAGVDTVVAVAPPRDGQGIYGPQLYTMNLAGADVILCLGGVQAFAALAFGVEDVAPVDLVVGAGNAYVAEAKRQLFGTVGIDLLAGPTEVAVIADETADPQLVAADLLGQAEHGFNSPALLVTTSRDFGTAVIAEVDRWLASDWPTVEVAGAAWREHGTVVVCESREEAVAVSDAYAPEHLEVQTSDDDWYAANLRNYGSLFIGPESTVAFSDKSIGTNHVLPTGRAARYTGGLWVGKFLKTVTYQRLTPGGARIVAPSTAAIADAELMYGHALTARLRLP